MYMLGTQILHIKSEVSNTIRYDTLSIWKYLCIIVYKCFLVCNKSLFLGLLNLGHLPDLQAHVEYETAKRHYAHVDCPGHADYVKVSYGTCQT